ncbi:MAG: transcription antitermination factor NusB [Gammaproteobacteria bacterium]
MNPITLRKKARRAVMQALYQWQLTQNPVSEIQAYILTQEGNLDREYFKEIFNGVMKELPTIDAMLATHTSRPLDEISPIEYAILRLSAYELLHRLDVPYKVVINEALDMSKEYGANEAHKFVNGILDKIAHESRV